MGKLDKIELEEVVEELEQYKGRATELISVYIPEGQNIYTVADQLEAEKSTAKNIKSTGTRKNVAGALDKITRSLKDFKKTPENGLAIFCGKKDSCVMIRRVWPKRLFRFCRFLDSKFSFQCS